jgi:hypothetical protein
MLRSFKLLTQVLFEMLRELHAVGLENAFELSQEPLRPIASTGQAEIEDHRFSGAIVLPEPRLWVRNSVLKPEE